MARTSRKNIVAPVKSPPTPKSEYSAALYARISVEDERKREADTIGNQIQLLRDFAGEDPDISVFDVYCDDDVSGTDFQRPEFSRMMNDIRDGKVNCVIVKDLSRLGRNHLESGEFIEMVLGFLPMSLKKRRRSILPSIKGVSTGRSSSKSMAIAQSWTLQWWTP